MHILASLGISIEDAIKVLTSAGGLAALAAIYSIIRTPYEIKLLRKRLDSQHKILTNRIFPKIARMEQYLIEEKLKSGEDLGELLRDIRKDQRPEADARDMQQENEE